MPKTRKQGSERDEDGSFKRACAAVIHDGTDETLINIEKGKKIKKNTLEQLYEKNIISSRAKYICCSCLNKSTQQSFESPTRKIDHPEQPSSSKETTSCTSNDYELCVEAGKFLSAFIESDVTQLYKTHDKCRLANLLGYNPSQWLEERPKALVGLLRELCGFDENSSVDKQLKLAKCVELIYGCRNAKLVLPLSFQESLLVYTVSRSKQLLTYNSRIAPAGSTDTISKWLTEQASSPIEFPEGMVRSVFDNEQVIGKTHTIRSDNKVPSSIITSHLYITMDPEITMQKDKSFSPINWLYDEPSDIQRAMLLEEKDINTDILRITRNDFISKRLASVIKDHTCENIDIVDAVIKKKDESVKEKVCFECGAQNEHSSRKCTNCSGQLAHEDPDLSNLVEKQPIKPYSPFSSVSTEENNFTVKTGEPDLCNPGSFENVADILSNISQRANIGQDDDNRKWLFIECDGGIYSLIEKLVFNVHYCSRCDESFYGIENYTDHRCYILHKVEPQYQYGWVLPLPGLLHIEMNACKSFFNITWDIVMKEICTKLGFSSMKALDFAKRCGDHHKSWKILEIFYLAVSDELLVPYVRKCIEDKVDPTVEGYWAWASDICDPNYMFLQQMTFTYLHSLMLFRVGCRRGNADAIVAGRDKMSHLFFARNHPMYQRIVTLNQYIEAMMPDELKNVVMSSLTLSRVGHKGHYQGGDACLEEINKDAKRWISKGVPTQDEWLRVFRNLDGLMKLQKKTLEMASGCVNLENTTGTYKEEQKVECRELIAVRELLRRKDYLLHPMVLREHKNLNGDLKLTDELRNFTEESELRKEQYFAAFLTKNEEYRHEIIFITEEEKHTKMCIENQTKSEIQKQILIMIDLKDPNEGKLMDDLFTKTVKGKSKEQYVQFYNMMKEDLQ